MSNISLLLHPILQKMRQHVNASGQLDNFLPRFCGVGKPWTRDIPEIS